MKITELNSILDGLEREELAGLVLELAKLRKDNMAWLEIRLIGAERLPESVEYYRKKILSGFYDKTGEPDIRLSVAKQAISDFRKASNDRESLIDLMIFYVEQGTALTLKYGDLYEEFYYSLECTYSDVIKLLSKWGDVALIEKFRSRLKALVTETKDMGWGYHDTLADIYDELQKSGGRRNRWK